MTDDKRLSLPAAPVLVTHARQGLLLQPDGEITAFSGRKAPVLEPPVIQCHGPATASRVGLKPVPGFDVLELFAFVRPAAFCLPTVRGLAAAVGVTPPVTLEDDAATLIEVVRHLLGEVSAWTGRAARDAGAVNGVMTNAGWPWGPFVADALGPDGATKEAIGLSALRIWTRLAAIEEEAPLPPPANWPVTGEEARGRLDILLGPDAERRTVQQDYTDSLIPAFTPKMELDEPNVVLAEAGTGIGKTLGYVAPASIWAEKNEGPVWISTYTRNLQRQIDQELDRLCTDPQEKARRVVIRKGRENYFCLLNYEEALNRAGTDPRWTIALALVARWALHTRTGDMAGGDFPDWLPDLLGLGRTLALTDRRGECIYAACPHYRTCYIEKTVRAARSADLVIANHALVMVQAALGGLDDGTQPTRYVFDESHHLFEAADSAFSAHLSGSETAELRRWLVGAEAGGRNSRARGLKRRLDDLLDTLDDGDHTVATALESILAAARSLPAPAWQTRIADGAPRGTAEAFLSAIRRQVYTRSNPDSPYSLETEINEPVEGLLESASELNATLKQLEDPLKALLAVLTKKLQAPTDEIDASTRARIDGLCRSLERRGVRPVVAWRDMIASLSAETPDEFVDWFGVERIDGRDMDVGLHRHWIDPTLPFARTVLDEAHGIVLTSATLRDGTGDDALDWQAARERTGLEHIAGHAEQAALLSPFDYADATRVFIVNDVRKDSLDQVSAAYRDLFLASGGGALGLFTAISRLRAVYNAIAADLDQAGLPLYGQHVDALATGTLVDIFRAEEDACLLGTDAIRDGVDVPGRSLRLMVFDRVPWPRPDILHRARRSAFGKRRYDDMITRLRLKQAFGRLIRRQGDRGVFVLLDSMMPSRLLGAFPDSVRIERTGLGETLKQVRDFFTAND